MTGRAPSIISKKRQQLGRYSAAAHRPSLGSSDGFERAPAASPVGPMVKVRDKAEQAMIEEAIARKARGG